MNNKSLFFYILLLSVTIACNNNSQEDILSKSPFASLTDSIHENPGDADLLFRRGELLSQHNQHELAFLDYESAWQKKQSEEIAMAYVSNLYLINKPREAVSLLEEAVKKFPSNPEFRRRLSEAYLQNGLSRKALEQYDSMLKTDSSNFEAWYEKGMLYAEMRDTAAALNAFEHSYALQPLRINGLPLANLYAELKNPKAIAICDDLISKDSAGGSLDPIFIKGIFYSNTKQYKPAIELFEECIRKDWKFVDAYLEKGILLYEMKNLDEALQTFKLASTISPRDADTYYWQGRCFESIGRKEEALDNYLRAYTLDRTLFEAKQRMDSLRKK